VLSEHLADEPMRVRLARNRYWEPRNYDGDYEGVVTVREALVRSKNVPTVQLAEEVGLDDVARTARQAGIHSPIDPTPSMALGTVAVSPLELATAYGAFAGLGSAAVPRMVLHVEAEDGEELWAAEAPKVSRLLDPGVAYLVTNVLQEAVVRGTGAAVGASGLEVPAAAGGTTNDATDWFGATRPTCGGVLDGIRRAAADHGCGHRRPAAPAWARMMKRVRAAARAESVAGAAQRVRRAWIPGSAPGGRLRAVLGEPYRELFLRCRRRRRCRTAATASGTSSAGWAATIGRTPSGAPSASARRPRSAR
jgi:penicillin-binding protein 1A